MLPHKHQIVSSMFTTTTKVSTVGAAYLAPAGELRHVLHGMREVSHVKQQSFSKQCRFSRLLYDCLARILSSCCHLYDSTCWGEQVQPQRRSDNAWVGAVYSRGILVLTRGTALSRQLWCGRPPGRLHSKRLGTGLQVCNSQLCLVI